MKLEAFSSYLFFALAIVTIIWSTMGIDFRKKRSWILVGLAFLMGVLIYPVGGNRDTSTDIPRTCTGSFFAALVIFNGWAMQQGKKLRKKLQEKSNSSWREK